MEAQLEATEKTSPGHLRRACPGRAVFPQRFCEILHSLLILSGNILGSLNKALLLLTKK